VETNTHIPITNTTGTQQIANERSKTEMYRELDLAALYGFLLGMKLASNEI